MDATTVVHCDLCVVTGISTPMMLGGTRYGALGQPAEGLAYMCDKHPGRKYHGVDGYSGYDNSTLCHYCSGDARCKSAMYIAAVKSTDAVTFRCPECGHEEHRPPTTN